MSGYIYIGTNGGSLRAEYGDDEERIYIDLPETEGNMPEGAAFSDTFDLSPEDVSRYDLEPDNPDLGWCVVDFLKDQYQADAVEASREKSAAEWEPSNDPGGVPGAMDLIVGDGLCDGACVWPSVDGTWRWDAAAGEEAGSGSACETMEQAQQEAEAWLADRNIATASIKRSAGFWADAEEEWETLDDTGEAMVYGGFVAFVDNEPDDDGLYSWTVMEDKEHLDELLDSGACDSADRAKAEAVSALYDVAEMHATASESGATHRASVELIEEEPGYWCNASDPNHMYEIGEYENRDGFWWLIDNNGEIEEGDAETFEAAKYELDSRVAMKVAYGEIVGRVINEIERLVPEMAGYHTDLEPELAASFIEDDLKDELLDDLTFGPEAMDCIEIMGGIDDFKNALWNTVLRNVSIKQIVTESWGREASIKTRSAAWTDDHDDVVQSAVDEAVGTLVQGIPVGDGVAFDDFMAMMDDKVIEDAVYERVSDEINTFLNQYAGGVVPYVLAGANIGEICRNFARNVVEYNDYTLTALDNNCITFEDVDGDRYAIKTGSKTANDLAAECARMVEDAYRNGEIDVEDLLEPDWYVYYAAQILNSRGDNWTDDEQDEIVLDAMLFGDDVYARETSGREASIKASEDYNVELYPTDSYGKEEYCGSVMGHDFYLTESGGEWECMILDDDGEELETGVGATKEEALEAAYKALRDKTAGRSMMARLSRRLGLSGIAVRGR